MKSSTKTQRINASMSSPNEVDIEVDENGSDNELSKEQRIEAARKKYEELKKKKKSKKKSKKKTEDEEGEGESKDNTPTLEDQDTSKGEEDSQILPGKEPESYETKESEPISLEHSTTEPENKTKPPTEPELSNAEVTANGKEKGSNQDDEESKDEKSESKETKELNPESRPNTDTTAESDEITALKETIESQKYTIRELRDSNTDLKLTLHDHYDQIKSLEDEIKRLKNPGNFPGTYIPEAVAPTRAATIAEPVYTSNFYADAGQDSSKPTDDFRERLMAWKGWQVDMTRWNGSAIAQKIAI